MFKEFLKEKFSYKLIFILLSFLPLALVTSSLLTNLIVILVSLIFLKIVFTNKEFKIHNNFFFILVFLFFIFLILNLKNSVDIDNSLNRTFGFLRFLLLAFSISYIMSFKNYRYINLILSTWFFIFLFVSIDLLFEYIFGHNLLGYSNQFPGRLSGLLNDELKIGEYYFGFIAISIATILYFQTKYIGILFAILFLGISILIGERANLIKIIFSLIIFFSLLRVYSIKQKALSIVFFLVFVVVTINSNGYLKNRFNNQFLGYIFNNSISEYYYISQYGAHYNSAIEVIKDNIFFGIGLKNFPKECSKDKYIDKRFTFEMMRCSTHPHQMHLDLLLSVGLIGYLILISSFLYLIIKNIKIYLKNFNIYTLSGICFLVTSLVAPLPSGSFFTTYSATIFWMNIGLILAFEKKK